MFLFRFSEEQKAQLLIKYKTLTSVDEKFEFWLNELKQPFSNFNTFDYQEVIEFDIHAIGEQAIRINELVINQAKIRERGFNKKSILDYDELFYELQNKIENSKNPIFTIEKEIEEIKNKIQVNKQKSADKHTGFYAKELIKLFLSTFENYYERGLVPNLSSQSGNKEHLIIYNNGYVLADFLLLLEQELEKLKARKSVPNIVERTLNEELLLLYYTDFLKLFDSMENKNRNEFLAIILKKSPNKIDQSLRYINSVKLVDGVKTTKNVANVISILTSLNLIEATKKAKIELSKLK